jgi:hypothetical protein
VLLATVPGISQVSREDRRRFGDWWRFTADSTTRLFAEAFGEQTSRSRARQRPRGAAFLYGFAAEELDEATAAPSRPGLRLPHDRARRRTAARPAPDRDEPGQTREARNRSALRRPCRRIASKPSGASRTARITRRSSSGVRTSSRSTPGRRPVQRAERLAQHQVPRRQVQQHAVLEARIGRCGAR